MTALAEHLEHAFEEPETEEARAAWTIRSLGEADWAMRKLSAARAAQAEARAEAQAQIDRINDWLNAELGRHESRADFFTFHLEQWWARQLAAQLAERGTAVGEPGWEEAWEKLTGKSRTLPGGGTVKARKVPASWDISDEFVLWAREHRPELVETKYVAKKSDVKAALAERVTPEGAVVSDDGEKIPGLAVEPPTVKVSVEVAS